MNRVVILDRIQEMIIPLNPPVNDFENSIRYSPFRILISVLLSSRTKDTVTRQASENLFSVADTPKKLEKLSEARIERLIYPVGFYKQKAKNIKRIAQIIAESGGVEIPSTFEELAALPGVGRKTANLVLALAFNKPSIAVDTHVFRISQRLGWASGQTPDQIEGQLRRKIPSQHWNRINQILVGFGQTICKPVSPKCNMCKITDHCQFFREQVMNKSGESV